MTKAAKAVKPAIAATRAVAVKKTVRKVPTKLDIAAAVAPAEQIFPIKKTSTAHASGYLTALQQVLGFLNDSRSFGEVFDKINRVQAEVQPRLMDGINAEIKSKRIDLNSVNVATENRPEGPVIRITKPEPATADSAAASNVITS